MKKIPRCLNNNSFNEFYCESSSSILCVLCENYNGNALTTTMEQKLPFTPVDKDMFKKLLKDIFEQEYYWDWGKAERVLTDNFCRKAKTIK